MAPSGERPSAADSNLYRPMMHGWSWGGGGWRRWRSFKVFSLDIWRSRSSRTSWAGHGSTALRGHSTEGIWNNFQLFYVKMNLDPEDGAPLALKIWTLFQSDSHCPGLVSLRLLGQFHDFLREGELAS